VVGNPLDSVIEYARKNSNINSFAESAIEMRKIGLIRSKDFERVDYTNELTRGLEVNLGFVEVAQYAQNALSFKTNLALKWKINNVYEIKKTPNLLKIILSSRVGTILSFIGMMNRIEKREECETLEIDEKLLRKKDRSDTITMVACDVYESDDIQAVISAVNQLGQELGHPNFSHQCGPPSDAAPGSFASRPTRPVSLAYIRLRVGFRGRVMQKVNAAADLRRGLVPTTMAGGLCVHFNLGTPEAAHIPKCTDTSASHKETHVCALCGSPDHGLHQCVAVRSHMGRIALKKNWNAWSKESDYRGIIKFKNNGNYKKRSNYRGKNNDNKNKNGKNQQAEKQSE